MTQLKVTIEDTQRDFINAYKKFGFKDRSALVRAAIARLEREMRLQALRQSAELYAEIYKNDPELQTLSEGVAEWPE